MSSSCAYPIRPTPNLDTVNGVGDFLAISETPEEDPVFSVIHFSDNHLHDQLRIRVIYFYQDCFRRGA